MSRCPPRHPIQRDDPRTGKPELVRDMRLPQTTFSLLIAAAVLQEEAALDDGDSLAADAFSSAIADLTQWAVLDAEYWASIQEQARHDYERMKADWKSWTGGTAQ